MVAIVVFMVIMIGGMSYFTLPQASNARQKMKRLAVSEAKQRLETFLGLGFHAVVTDSNETGTSVTLAGLTGSRDTTITYVDDAGDGTGGSDADSDIVDYKKITVSIFGSHFSVAEHLDCRDPLNTIIHGNLLMLFGIDFDQLPSAVGFVG